MEKYINEHESYNAKMYGEFLYYLDTRYDSCASFYKKAEVLKYNNALYLKSYSTIVAKIDNGEVIVNGWYSQTTARHINEFLQQNGFKKMSKKEMNGE